MANESSNMKVTPWEVEGLVDYEKLIEVFGVKPISNDVLKLACKTLGSLHFMLRRRIFYAHRDFDVFLNDFNEGKAVALYTGRGPSGYVHLGHLLPWIFTKWLQEKLNLDLYFQLTDDEKFLYHKEFTLKQVSDICYDNILDIIAVGLNPKKTHIIVDSEDISFLYRIAIKVAKKITFSTIKAVFGFTESINIGMTFFPSLQIAVCFLPT